MAKKQKENKDITELEARIDWATRTLHAMLHGEKPALDPQNESQSWLFNQMTRMYKAGFLCEEPESYLTLPGEEGDADIERYKGVTIREPLPKQLTSEYKDLKEVIEKREISNFKVFGFDGAYRYHGEPLDQLEDSNAFVLTKGGIMELYQWLMTIRAQLDDAIDFDDKLVIVQNADGFWNKTLEALDGLDNVAKSHAMTDTRHDTAEILDYVYAPDLKERVPEQSEGNEIVEPGSTIFFVTGNRKKVYDYKKVFKRRGTDIECAWFQQKFDKPMGADEFSYSYMGNLVEKIHEMYKHIRDHYGAEGFRQAMLDKGYDIDKAVLWFDDSGLELTESLTNGPEFGNCTYRMNPYKKHGPGAEMKNAINAMQNQPFHGERSIKGFIKRLEVASERLHQERIDAGEDEPKVSTRAVDRNCVAIVPIKGLVDDIEAGASFDDVMENVPMQFFQAVTEHDLVFEPRPEARAMDSKNFLVPRKDPYKRTQAENTHYVEQHSITAQVVKAAARVLGFDQFETVKGKLARNFDSKAGVGWRIGTQQSIHKGMKGQGLGNAVRKKLKGLYRLMPGNGGDFDLMLPREHTLTYEDDTTEVMKNALNNFYDFTLKAHGFLLTPDSRKVSGDDFFWHRTFTFFSLIVGRQINDKAVTSKPFLVMDTPTWKPFIRLLETYSGGLIPEMPHEIIDAIVEKKKNLVKDLNRAFSEYLPDEVPNYVFTDDGETCPDDLFNVTVYCSASTTDYPMKMWARDFSFDCGAMGFALKNGGGTGPDGLMIETSEGIRKVKTQFDDFLRKQGLAGAPETHISSIQCVDTAQEEGLCKFNDYWAVYPTIYQRMHELQNADAEVVLPGGAGTIQEIAASVLMRKAGIYPIENRPLIIVNHQGIYDPFLKMIPDGDRKLYNIKVVDTTEQALKVLMKARKARNMEPVLPYTKDEYEKLKKSFERDLRRQERDSQPKEPMLN